MTDTCIIMYPYYIFYAHTRNHISYLYIYIFYKIFLYFDIHIYLYIIICIHIYYIYTYLFSITEYYANLHPRISSLPQEVVKQLKELKQQLPQLKQQVEEALEEKQRLETKLADMVPWLIRGWLRWWAPWCWFIGDLWAIGGHRLLIELQLMIETKLGNPPL